MPNYPIKIAITLSPKQDLTKLQVPQVQLAKYAYLVCKLLRKYSTYYGRPELTLSGLIHYHLILEIEDNTQYIQWTRTTLHNLKKLGNTKVKIVHDATGWRQYIDKDIEVYDEIFKNVWSVPINITPNGVKKYLKDPLKDIPLNDLKNHVSSLDEGINKIIKSHKIHITETLGKPEESP